MRARIQVAGGTHGDLLALRDWLAGTPEFHDRVTFELPGAQPGEKGGLATVVLVSLGAGGTSPLAESVSAWLDRRDAEVTVLLTAPDGGTAELTRGRVTCDYPTASGRARC